MLGAASARRSTVCGIEIDAGAAGDVVKADGNGVYQFCKGEKVLELTFLRGFVVVGIGREDGVDAGNLAEHGSLTEQGTGAVVGATGPDRDAAGGCVDHDANGAQPFVIRRASRLRQWNRRPR